MIFEIIKTKCPFCERQRDVTVSTFLPRMVFDCRCKSTLEVRPVKQTTGLKFWACDWTIAGAEQ